MFLCSVVISVDLKSMISKKKISHSDFVPVHKFDLMRAEVLHDGTETFFFCVYDSTSLCLPSLNLLLW